MCPRMGRSGSRRTVKLFWQRCQARPRCSLLVSTGLAVLLLSGMHDSAGLPALEDWHWRADAVWRVPDIKNLSGITWQADSETFFAISNNPTVVIELDRDGRELRRIRLSGFHDTEDIAWLGGHRFAVVEERRCRLVTLSIEPDARVLEYADVESQALDLPGACEVDNRGLEALAYDAVMDRLYVGQEKKPRRLWTIDAASADQPGQPVLLHEDPHEDWFGDDIAAITVPPGQDRVLVLSEASRRLTAMDTAGLPQASRWVGSPLQWVRQPEGVALDTRGDLYVVSEPNRVYRFRRQ